MSEILLYIAVGLTLLFAYSNGFHDGCNVIATLIGSRSMKPRRALFWGALAEFVGPLVLGTAVAGTVANKVLRPEALSLLATIDIRIVIIATVISAIGWNIVTWIWGLPSSSSHALIGGLLGAGLATLGPSAIAQREILIYVVLPLFISPILGFVAGFIIYSLIKGFFSGAHSSIRYLFIQAQTPGMLLLGAGHGSNDAQKSMGLIVLALAAGSGAAGEISVPWWVVIACATAIALGLSTGGWTIIRTVGYDIFRIQPVHSFASQISSTLVIGVASVLGGPVSTTQVVASSVLGVGSSRRISGVRWTLARNIAYAWILTIPITALISAGVCRGLIWFLAQL